MTSPDVDVVIIGGGPAGLTAAIALAAAGVATALIDKGSSAPDHRSTALLCGSVKALVALGVWDRCTAHVAPLRAIRIVDDSGRLFRTPEVCFTASEIGTEAFGYNIENPLLIAALEARARVLAAVRWIRGRAQAVEIASDRVSVRLEHGAAVSGRLAIGADGRQSLCRAAAGIRMEGRSYSQTALTLNLTHTRPHHDTTTEFHTRTGPFTLVPLPGRRASLVFAIDATDVPRVAALSDHEMGQEIEHRSHSLLGKITVEPGRRIFPLTVETAATFGLGRIALVGEAAHVLPPIGAQGLNLGLRDAATIAELVAAAHRAGRNVGDGALTAQYETMRRADVMTRTLAVDLLNRSLLTDFLPLQAARGFGLFLLQQVGPLRRAAMREGIMPIASQPQLMRGEMP